MWGFKDKTVIGFNSSSMHKMIHWYPYFCSRYPWESIKACIGLSLLISSVSIYVCVKKLTICCWTSLYPWLHPCCCCCRFFFLLFLRLFAPRRRSLLGLVPLNPHPLLPSSSTVPVPCFLLLPPPHGCNKGSVPPAQRWLLWLHNQQSSMASAPFPSLIFK